MIEVTRAYTQIATMLQQQSDLHKSRDRETCRRSGITAIRETDHARASYRCDRNGGPGTQRSGHLQQHRQPAHHRLQEQTAAFQDLIYEHIRRVGAQASDQGTILPVGIDIGGGVKTVGTPRAMTQGTLSQTGNDLDIAITRRRLLQDPDAGRHIQYTRDGTFQMDEQGRIVNAQGNPVQPTITIPQNSTGHHRQRAGPGFGNAAGLDDADHRRPDRPDAIHQQGRPAADRQQPVPDTPASGPPQDGIANTEGYGDMQQSNLEQANVEVVSEMSDLIAAQRAYEMNAKVISAADQMLQSTAALFR